MAQSATELGERGRELPLVLVVDDHALVRTQICGFLEATGHYRVATASDGLEALVAVRKLLPAVVLTDVTMPKLDGRRLAAAIKGNTATRHVQVILLTALGGSLAAVDGLNAGADDYITKPFEENVLTARVDAAARMSKTYNDLAARTTELEHTKQALEVAIARREEAEAETRLTKKLEAIGQLAAGIAHEINTPAQYVGDNLAFVTQSVNDLLGFVLEQQRVLAGSADSDAQQLLSDHAARIDYAYLAKEVPRALEQSSEGMARIARIVSAMKDFARPGGAEKSPIDVNRMIENTITIALPQWRDVADVVLQLDGTIPLVVCHEVEMQQVLMNLLTNAVQAIDAVRSVAGPGRVEVTTKHRDGAVEILVADTGCGIAEIHRERVFDPFFTTKDVGQGAGQGLHVVRSVVVERHGGRVSFVSEVGKGTEFRVTLPVQVDDAAFV